MERKKKTEETSNVVFTSVKNMVEPWVCNYTTVDKLDEALADVEKQIKNIDKKHSKKTKGLEKLYDSLNTNLLQLESEVDDNKSELQSKTDKLANEFRDYMQYQEDVKHFKEFCKKYLRCDFDEEDFGTHFDILEKLYRLVIKRRIKQLKREYKSLGHFNAYSRESGNYEDKTEKMIEEIFGVWEKNFVGTPFKQFKRIVAYNKKNLR